MIRPPPQASHSDSNIAGAHVRAQPAGASVLSGSVGHRLAAAAAAAAFLWLMVGWALR